MLRTLVVALALAVPGVAAAQQFPDSAVGIEVRGDDGTVVGHVEAVERDREGRIVAAELSGQEPADAPYASSDLVAERNDAENTLINDRGDQLRGRDRATRGNALLR